MILYRTLRAHGFAGDVAVYPYFDSYEPRLDPLLPADLYVVGHGSGAGMLARDYRRLGPMGDTWLDNVFAAFRPPTAARMHRLLADRGSFWIGGALCGSELPWESIGFFGWEPTATVNSFRYRWAKRQFGQPHALAVVELLDVYEQLQEIYDQPMLPVEWMKLTPDGQGKIAARGRDVLRQYRLKLSSLEAVVGDARRVLWFRQMSLFGSYFEYLLRRLEVFSRMHAIVARNKNVLGHSDGLPEPLRQELLALHRQVVGMGTAFDHKAAKVPSDMIVQTRNSN